MAHLSAPAPLEGAGAVDACAELFVIKLLNWFASQCLFNITTALFLNLFVYYNLSLSCFVNVQRYDARIKFTARIKPAPLITHIL